MVRSMQPGSAWPGTTQWPRRPLPERAIEVETTVSNGNLILMFRECPFCGNTHRSPYVDELENTVLSCRDKACPDKRGTLETWPEPDTVPVRCETQAYSRAA